MMSEYVLVGGAALFASLLTFFSGFGLGTILTPVFMLFFPIELAVAMTAIVHFLNNVFKLLLVGRSVHLKTALKFGLPAIVSAYFGAKLLLYLSSSPTVYQYHILGYQAQVSTVKITVAVLMALFAILEMLPSFKSLSFEQNKLPLGGILSGFFGGISGHQGALRSLFLIKCNLSKESFIATGVAIAICIDISRISTYFNTLSFIELKPHITILITAISCAFFGAFFGKKVLKKITLKTVQINVSVLIILLAVLLGLGII